MTPDAATRDRDGLRDTVASRRDSASHPSSLPDLLDQLVEQTDGSTTTVGRLVKAFGTRSFGPMLLIPAIIAVAPTGAIPGMSLVTGSIIFVVSAQMFAGRTTIWLPGWALALEVPRDRLENAVNTAKPWANRLNRWISRRWTALSQPPLYLAIPFVCMSLALSMFPLALLPFAVAIPGTAVALLAIGLTFRDGAFIVGGYLLSALTGYAIFAST